MNTEQEFVARVKAARPPGVSQTSLDQAIAYFLEHHWLERRVLRECMHECIDLARRFDILVAASAAPRDAGLVQHLRLTPHDLLTSDDLAEKIRPAVDQVRHTLFGDPQPPFATSEGAVQWLEQTAAAQETQARADSPRRAALEETILAQLAAWQALTGESCEGPFVPELLEYAKPGDPWVHRVPVRGKTPLADLGSASRQLADATGFSPASVVAYILAGIRPLLVPISIRMSSGFHNDFKIARRSATIELRTPHVTDAQLRAIRQVIRRVWHTAKKKPLTESDRQFLAIVQRLGGVPQDEGERERIAFFERVRQTFNALAVEHGYPQHSTWRATRNKYARLLKKMQQGNHDAQAVPQEDGA